MRDTILKVNLNTCSLEEKLQAVEQHFLQAKDEMLQKNYSKMNKTQKALYYDNHLNKCNIFCNKIKIPNTLALLKLNELCDTIEKRDLFIEKFYNPCRIMQSMDDFEEYLENSKVEEKTEYIISTITAIADVGVRKFASK